MKKRLTLLLVLVMLFTVSVTYVNADSMASTPGSAIGAGLAHYIVLKEDGTVWGWGDNRCFEVGAGLGDFIETPVQVKGIKDVIAVSAYDSNTIALKKDGTVWAWGENESGLLDSRNSANVGKPVRIEGLDDIIAISGRLALKKDGTVWEWGLRDRGTNAIIPPVQVKGLTDVVEIASHAALKKDGTVVMWSYYGFDMFGSYPEKISGPVTVENLSDVISISYGSGNVLALKKDGTVWTWGIRAWGESVHAGGSTWYTYFDEITPTPKQIDHISDVVRIAAGDGISAGIKSDGTVWVWGSHVDGLSTIVPMQVRGLSNAKEIACGRGRGVVLTDDGSVWRFNSSSNATKIPIKLDYYKKPANTDSIVRAAPADSKILVNGREVSFEAYNINGSNYFKLRDLAMAVNGTKKQFSVGWDAEKQVIDLVSGAAYKPVGNELAVSGNLTAKEARPTKSQVFVRGRSVQVTAYNINGNNYFKLRDIAKMMNFGVVWEASTKTIGIDTEVPYDVEILEIFKADPEIAGRSDFTKLKMRYYSDEQKTKPLLDFEISVSDVETMKYHHIKIYSADDKVLAVAKEIIKYFYPNSYETAYDHYHKAVTGGVNYDGVLDSRDFSALYSIFIIGRDTK